MALHTLGSWLANRTCAAEALDTEVGDAEEDTEIGEIHTDSVNWEIVVQ